MNTVHDSKENVVNDPESDLTVTNPVVIDPDQALLAMFHYVQDYFNDYDLMAIEAMNACLSEYFMNAGADYKVHQVMTEFHGIIGSVNLIVQLKTLVDKIKPGLEAAKKNSDSIFYSPSKS